MANADADVLVIGGGPAGASVAIHLARAGWHVAVIERSAYPRQKVCGECLGPASLHHLRTLGVTERLLDLAGPEIRRVAWMTRGRTTSADMPPCPSGPYRYGRAIGRDVLDTMLLERARELGVRVIQPAQARRVHGVPGAFVCEYRSRSTSAGLRPHAADERICAPILIDAHGSWERGSFLDGGGPLHGDSRPARPADLLGFKATFSGAALPGGLLPVLSLPGGYGGMVVSDRGRTTVACCIRRDALSEWRLRLPGSSAGAAVDAFLRSSCPGVAGALDGARAERGWQSIGPLRPGFHARSARGALAVGNAAAEAHPLIGEGICMAFESTALLATLLGNRPSHVDERRIWGVHDAYIHAMQATFARRLRLARFYAYVAIHPLIATAMAALLQSWPQTLTLAARLAGKASSGAIRIGARQTHHVSCSER